MNTKLIASLASAIVLSGCASRTPPATTVGVDMRLDGIAKTCTASTAEQSAGGTATIAMTNDGWCGAFVADGAAPYQLGLVRARPSNGRVFIQPIGPQTRVEYTANPGFTGTDTFTVALRPRTANAAETMLSVNVTVTAADRPAVAAPVAPTARPPAARTPAARTPAARTPPARTAPRATRPAS